jgi:2-oxoacid:acceptor oxidoreductase delta subunit (pyruvate/2-ketoisovalerate family)
VGRPAGRGRGVASKLRSIGCDNCYGVCPDNAIIKLADGQYAVDYDYCKGCGLCAAECPCGAIEMEPEPT